MKTKALHTAAVVVVVLGMVLGCDTSGPNFGDIRDQIDTDTPITAAEADAWERHGFDPKLFEFLDAWTETDIENYKAANEALLVEFLQTDEPREWEFHDQYRREDGTIVQVWRSGPYTQIHEIEVIGTVDDPEDDVPSEGIPVDSEAFRRLNIEVPNRARSLQRKGEAE